MLGLFCLFLVSCAVVVRGLVLRVFNFREFRGSLDLWN